MAVGCSNRSILLFSTANHTLSNLYSTLYHLPKDMEDNPPTGIETEFEIKDISWNPQNPSRYESLLSSRHARSLRNGGLQCCRSVGHSTSVCLVIVDYHRNLPYKYLSQTQRVSEVCWMTHPGSLSSEEYLSVLQQRRNGTSIDVFRLRSLPRFSSVVCMTALSITNYEKLAVVLNASSREQPHIPPTLRENEVFSFSGESKEFFSFTNRSYCGC